MTTLKYEQQAKITQLTALHAQYILAKAELRAKVEAEYQGRLRDFELRESRLMNEALNLSVPKTVVGRAIGTTSWNTIAERLSLTADEFIEIKETPSYEVDSKTSTLVVHWVEVGGQRKEVESTLDYSWRAIAKSYKLDWSLTDGSKLSELVNADFNVVPEIPITEWEKAINDHENR